MSKQLPLNVPAPHHFTYAVRDLPEVTVEQRELRSSGYSLQRVRIPVRHADR